MFKSNATDGSNVCGCLGAWLAGETIKVKLETDLGKELIKRLGGQAWGGKDVDKGEVHGAPVHAKVVDTTQHFSSRVGTGLGVHDHLWSK